MFGIEENGLTAEIYEKLRDLVAFQHYEKWDVEQALTNSLYTVVIWDEKRPVGMGRVVGDGKVAFFFKDIVVDPKYLKQGIGSMVMNALMKYVYKNGCNNAYLALLSTPGKEAFYEQFGFHVRPCKGLGSGMSQYIIKNRL